MSELKSRPVLRAIQTAQVYEGGGFPVRRPYPTSELALLDPFLLLDEMGPVEWAPGEAIGAPDHPHRGFETVTYLLKGRMQHKDSAGNSGMLNPGDVQWMTAGSGVVHSEMPEAEFLRQGGLSHGFQIWVNLPAKDKMIKPRYQEVAGSKIPQAQSADGKVSVKIIAGESLGKKALIETHTPIGYLHFNLTPGGAILQPIAAQQMAFVYVFAGEVLVGPDKLPIRSGNLALMGEGEAVQLAVAENAAAGAELLLLSGVPLREPIARYGPFVMNTRDEIAQAMADYQNGKLGVIQH